MVLRSMGYVAFFLGSFVVCLYLTFPWQAVKQRVLGEASKRLGVRITASSLEPSWLTGIHAEKIKVELKDDAELELERLDARASLLSFLMGGYGGSLRLPLARGKLKAYVFGDKKKVDTEAQVDGVELALVPGLKTATGLALAGTVNLEADVELGLENPAESQGKLTLQATGLETLKGGKVSGFPVPELVLGNLDWTVPVEAGKVIIRNQRLDGPNLQANLNGEIVLQNPLGQSLVNAVLKFKPTPAFLQKEPLMGSLLRNIDRFKHSDGFYTFQLSRTLKHVRIEGKRP